MNLTMTEFQLLVQGNFLNLIKAEVFVAASYARSFDNLKFYAKVTVDLSGLNKVSNRPVIVDDFFQPWCAVIPSERRYLLLVLVVFFNC